MMTIDVLLSGRLKLDGYGQGHPVNDDTSFRLALNDGSTVRDVIGDLQVPADQVALTMVNGCRCPVGTNVKSGDRVILIPQDVAALWGAFRRQTLDMGVGFDV